MVLVCAILALTLVVGLASYYIYSALADISYNVGLLVGRFDTQNQQNDDMINLQGDIHDVYVEWRKEDVARLERIDALGQEQHEIFIANQLAQRTGAISIAQSVDLHTTILDKIVSIVQSQQPKRSHHKKAVQEPEALAVTEVLHEETTAQELAS